MPHRFVFVLPHAPKPKSPQWAITMFFWRINNKTTSTSNKWVYLCVSHMWFMMCSQLETDLSQSLRFDTDWICFRCLNRVAISKQQKNERNTNMYSHLLIVYNSWLEIGGLRENVVTYVRGCSYHLMCGFGAYGISVCLSNRFFGYRLFGYIWLWLVLSMGYDNVAHRSAI